MRFSAHDIYGNDFTSGHDPWKGRQAQRQQKQTYEPSLFAGVALGVCSHSAVFSPPPAAV